jgi:uncharacterized protein involved in exopolysaccharide biosynthesis
MEQQQLNETEPELDLKSFLLTVKKTLLQLWDARKQLAIINGSLAVIFTAGLFIFGKPYYESTITILPEYGNKLPLGGLSGLASLAGLSMGDAAPTEIYENLILSESVLAPVFYSKYATQEFPDSVNLIQYFELEPDEDLPQPMQRRKMFLELYKRFTERHIRTDLGRVNRILDVTVTMPEPALTSEVANRIMKQLDEYVRVKRKSNAFNQRFYIEKRINQVKDSLETAEDMLKRFREKNRIILQSPELLLEQTRLIRNVEIIQAVFMQLTQQLELAKIDEIRDAPVVNIKENADVPIIKKGPKRFIILVILMMVSVVVTALYQIALPQLRDYYLYLRSTPAE